MAYSNAVSRHGKKWGRPRLKNPTAKARVLAAHPDAVIMGFWPQGAFIVRQHFRVHTKDGYLGAGSPNKRAAWCAARDVVASRKGHYG